MKKKLKRTDDEKREIISRIENRPPEMNLDKALELEAITKPSFYEWRKKLKAKIHPAIEKPRKYTKSPKSDDSRVVIVSCSPANFASVLKGMEQR